MLAGDDALFEELQDALRRARSSPARRASSSPASSPSATSGTPRVGASRYLVEPNVKEGKGGQRDLQTLFWIAKYFYRVASNEALVDARLLSRKEYALFRRCDDFLWAVRCHLHFLAGRAEERLSFDVQPELAAGSATSSIRGWRRSSAS